MRFPYLLPATLVVLHTMLVGQVTQTYRQTTGGLAVGQDLAHQGDEWHEVEKHLPDPATASPHALEVQADILRARRFPEDALNYYNYALKRGAKPEEIFKKIGMTHLELHNNVLARMYFQKAVKLDRKDAAAWNDLGAVEYLNQQMIAAIGDYKRSVKLDAKSAVYHSNLGMAYFDTKDFRDAQKQIAMALKLDPEVFTRASAAGVSAHVLSPEDRAQFCLEMAKMYAQAGNQAEMLHSLQMAGEAGADVLEEMGKDKVLASYRKDPRVLLLVQNSKALRTGRPALAEAGAVAPASSPSTP